MNDSFHVTDPRALKAVAHPLRVRLLGALRSQGPATATELAAMFGESSGSTSYHLRQLAKYGFVEEDSEQRDRRERRWRAVHAYTSWSNTELAGTPEGREAVAFMRRRQLEVLRSTVEVFDRDSASWSPEWIEAAGISDDIARLTPASVATLYARVSAMVKELEEHDKDAPDTERVSVFVSAHPVRGYVG
ncbi:helix-turn-helix domain-containing protein [Microtetraspora fusca]|uniref:helix-turn-helix domain-containing protein n=1 Tax=Microtetraspora fusca TaxID=1997 RepID=UPI0008365911|nr:helix-turn-helix domain-containing protein [Microtetraspora fusca]